MNVLVAVKKAARRRRRSEKRPYRGWNAAELMRHAVVSQEIVLAALKSDLITVYVEAVIAPSNPKRKTLVTFVRLEHPWGIGLPHLFKSTQISSLATTL